MLLGFSGPYNVYKTETGHTDSMRPSCNMPSRTTQLLLLRHSHISLAFATLQHNTNGSSWDILLILAYHFIVCDCVHIHQQTPVHAVISAVVNAGGATSCTAFPCSCSPRLSCVGGHRSVLVSENKAYQMRCSLFCYAMRCIVFCVIPSAGMHNAMLWDCSCAELDPHIYICRRQS